MGMMDKFKNMFNMSEEEFLDDVDIDEEEPEKDDYSHDVRSNFSFGHKNERDSKVVDIRSSVPAAAAASSKAHVVFKKLDRYEDVGSVADVLNEKRIVILNLETCPNDATIRIIDFLSGVVAYANNGDIKRVAGRAYIITPYNVPLTGELLDEVEHSNY